MENVPAKILTATWTALAGGMKAIIMDSRVREHSNLPEEPHARAVQGVPGTTLVTGWHVGEERDVEKECKPTSEDEVESDAWKAHDACRGL